MEQHLQVAPAGRRLASTNAAKAIRMIGLAENEVNRYSVLCTPSESLLEVVVTRDVKYIAQ
jgi:hypothetical protein